MGLFSTVISKECTNPECEEFKQPKPANSPAACLECGSPMKDVTKTNLPVIVGTLVVLVVVIGGGGYFGMKWWAYNTAKKALLSALGSQNASTIETAWNAYRQINNALEKCPECVDQFENFLVRKFDEAMQNDNLGEAQQVLQKIRDLGRPNACPDCDQQVASLQEQVSYQQDIPLQPVEAETFQFTDYLNRYLGYLGSDSISITEPFTIQAAEVTVGEFREYVDSLDEEAKAAIGDRWAQNSDGVAYPDDRPVENVSWQEANAYAQWLSAKTGWTMQLPTREQWAAACAKYPDPQPVLGRLNTDEEESEPLRVLRKGRDIDHLLGNVREWSADGCGEGQYYVLGENYMTDPTDPEAVGRPNCAKDSKWAGVGFRLVRMGE